MSIAEREPTTEAEGGYPQAAAGEIAGIVAGCAYLLVQMSLMAGARAGGAFAPLRRIAAMVLGPDGVPASSSAGLGLVVLALLLHFALAVVYGRLVCALVWQRGVTAALFLGAAIGVALYGVNFELIAPAAFPWFAAASRLATLADHALFGALAAAVCVLLRRRTI